MQFNMTNEYCSFDHSLLFGKYLVMYGFALTVHYSLFIDKYQRNIEHFNKKNR